jgi:CheY-like chemotaxis protein
VSLKVLLADDSMTAQNMAKKILAESGYEVTTVSNGAAAVKKIAEVKPDLVILDIYMPGYTGLEVCERVRANLETANMPVLLTVGKMEPYRPEDGARVRADGIIVKPFEATDLLAIVKKISEKFAPVKKSAQPMYDDTIEAISSAENSRDGSYEEFKASAHVDVPAEMGVAPAMEFNDNPTGDTTAPITMDWAPSAAAMQSPATEFAPAIPMESAAPSSTPPAFTPFHIESAPGTITDSMPAYVEPEISAYAASSTFNVEAVEPTVAPPEPSMEVPPLPEIEFNAAPAQDVHVERAPDFEPTVSTEEIEVPDAVQDPELVTDVNELAKFTTGFGVENPEEVPVGTVTGNEPFFTTEVPSSEVPELVTENVFPTGSLEDMEVEEEPAPAENENAPQEHAAAENNGFAISEVAPGPAKEALDDFEARVAAAMSAFEHPLEESATTESEPVVLEQVDNFVGDPEIINPITAEPAQESSEPEETPAPVSESRRMLDVNETMVLPAEALLSLEAEMRKAMELKQAAMSTEPAPPSHEQVMASFTAEPIQQTAPESNGSEAVETYPDTFAEQFAEPESMPAPSEDHESIQRAEPVQEPQTASALAMAAAAAIPALENSNGFGQEKLANAVQKAVERLQPQIIAEIMKALKGE